MAGEQRRRRLRALLKLAEMPADALESVEQAFVRESAANEQQILSNERMEFLGDAVLGLVAAHWLYKTYPDEKEGVLAKRKAVIVSGSAIAKTAKRLRFADLVQLGAGERAEGGSERTSTLEDAFEAFVAAVYISLGLEAARRFIEREHVANVDVELALKADFKTQLQELTQAHLACTPTYSEQAEGPPHLRTFTSVVTVNGEALGTGTGPSKKAAQQQAAAQALQTLQGRFS